MNPMVRNQSILRRPGLVALSTMALAVATALAAPDAAPRDAEAAEAGRLDPPVGRARDAAERVVRDAFGDALDATGQAERIDIADKLINTAAATEDPDSRFVLYETAAELAALAGKPDLLLAAAEPIVDRYDVDPIAYPHQGLTTAQRWTRDPVDAASLAEALLDLHARALADDRYDLAVRLARQAAGPARIARSAALGEQARRAERSARLLAKAYERLEPDLARLAESPDDPEANEAVGRFYAFTADDVARALPYLAKGADEALAALAKTELEQPAEPDDRFELARLWWDWGGAQRGDDRPAGLARAVHWYQAVLPDLDGLAKVTAERRIDHYYDKYADALGVVDAGDVALAEKGASAQAPSRPEELIDGNSARYDGSSGFASGEHPCAFTVDLGKTYRLRRLRLLLWDGDARRYKYTASVSVDGRRWTTVADHADEPSHGWQTIDFPPRPVRHIRVRGLHNTANAGFHIVELEAYCKLP